VAELIPRSAVTTGILAVTALAIAYALGLPLGRITGTRRRGIAAAAIRAVSLGLLSMPPLLTSLFLVFVAARSGWLLSAA